MTTPTTPTQLPVSTPSEAPPATSPVAGTSTTSKPAPAPAKTYTVKKTFGPFNGAAKIGEPGSVPDGEALAVYCAPREAVVGATTKINRKTSHGTTKKDVLKLDVIGVFYDSDRGDLALGVGAFAHPTGKSGWNSVTITATCRR